MTKGLNILRGRAHARLVILESAYCRPIRWLAEAMSTKKELVDVKIDMPYHLQVSGLDVGSSDQEESSDCNCMMDEVTCTPMDVSELDLHQSWRKGAFGAVVSFAKMSGPLILFIIVCVIITLLCRSYINDLIITLEELPVWESLLVFVGLYTIVSFPFAFGCIILNMACGYLYGVLEGTLIAVVATEFGYLVVFYLSRRCMRHYAETQVTSPYLVSVMRVMEGPNGLKVTILFRLMPLPLGVQNSILAVSDHSKWFLYTHFQGLCC